MVRGLTRGRSASREALLAALRDTGVSHDSRSVRSYPWSRFEDPPIPLRQLEAAGLTPGLVRRLGGHVVHLGIEMLVRFPVAVADLEWLLAQGWGGPLLREHGDAFDLLGLSRLDLLTQTYLSLTGLRDVMIPPFRPAAEGPARVAAGPRPGSVAVDTPLSVALATARHTEPADAALWYAAWSDDPDRLDDFEGWLARWVDAGYGVGETLVLAALPPDDTRRVSPVQFRTMTSLRQQPGRAGGTYNYKHG